MSNQSIKAIRLVGDSEMVKLTPTTSRVAKSHKAKRRLVILSKLYRSAAAIGVDMPTDQNVIIGMADFVGHYFGDLKPEHITMAFDEAAAGRISVDLKTYGAPLSNKLVGQVLNAYRAKLPKGSKPQPPTITGPVMSSTQIVQNMVKRLVAMRTAAQNGGGVHLLKYLFDFITRCGVQFSEDQRKEAEQLAVEILKRRATNSRHNGEMRPRQFTAVMEAIEQRNVLDIELETSKQLLLMWLKTNTTPEPELIKDFTKKYDQWKTQQIN